MSRQLIELDSDEIDEIDGTIEYTDEDHIDRRIECRGFSHADGEEYVAVFELASVHRVTEIDE